MAEEVVMPRLSDTMDSGIIAKWLKQEGDEVKKGDIIAEIETDKANMELESYASGIMARISVREGQSAEVGAPIALIASSPDEAKSLQGTAEGGADKAPSPDGKQAQRAEAAEMAPVQPAEQKPGAAQPAQAKAEQPPAPPEGEAEAGERIKASPLARRLAAEHGIGLEKVSGTGPSGRITKEDIEAFMQQAATAAPTRAKAGAPEVAPPLVGALPPTAPVAPGGPRAAQPVEMSRMQHTIARRMAEAKFSAPEFVLTIEVDMTEARKLLASLKVMEGAPKIGPNDFLIKAVAAALTQHPEVNAGWENNNIVQYGRINIGNAVAIPGGLVVPVIQDADRKSLGQIAVESKSLIEKARSNKLAPSEYEGGTFTVSNLGMYGIEQFTPIINVPEACIIGVGSIVPKPIVIDGEVIVRDRMRLTLAGDHRVINGAQGAEFLRTLQRLLENPMLTVL